MLTACGLMTSINTLDPPVSTGAVGSDYTFRLDGSAWAADGIEYVFFGIEIYYKIIKTDVLLGDLEMLTASSQLAGRGFKRMYREGEKAPDEYDKPMLNIRNYIDPPAYSFLDFGFYFNPIFGDPDEAKLIATIKDDAGNPLETFELKRSVFFPDGFGNGLDYFYKGFNEFEQNDSDINNDIWLVIDGEVDSVYLLLYAYSFGYSLNPSHIWLQLESSLEYLGKLSVKCKKYTP
jgi:hypothetical protein